MNRARPFLLFLTAANLSIAPSPAADHLNRDELSALDLAEYLKPVPPKTLGEAMEAFEVIEGVTLELVAAEPLVIDPVAAAIDEDGLLYVAELRDYPYKPKEGDPPLGRIRLLEDTDSDGLYDRSSVFAESLLWAAGVACWKGGVFVSSPPDIWYLKDTDGDRKADRKEKVYTGFGTDGAQYTLNNLIWGLDHKVYASVAGNGGEVVPVSDPHAQPLSLQKADVRFDPISGAIEPQSGNVQFGNTFDDWGNRFLCSQDSPLYHVVFPLVYMERNADLPGFSGVHEITGDNVPIFRSSPLERWRIIRSSMRVVSNRGNEEGSGVSHHVLDAVAGTTLYRGGAFPDSFYGNAISGDAQNNLVHRRALLPDGVTFTSRRADPNTEFIRSQDNWFRPVNFLNAPDGTLYMLDLYREILEAVHIPYDVVKHLDLTSGRDRGRIYRIQPEGFEPPPQPRLGQASTLELVALLEDRNSWKRETAHRLLYERQDPASVEPLRDLLAKSPRPQARLHALWSLQGLSQLQDSDLERALRDDEAAVREHAVLLSEERLKDSPSLSDKVLSLAQDPAPRVRYQVAFILGETDDERAVQALAGIALSDSTNQWILRAVLTSASKTAPSMLENVLRRAPDSGRLPDRDFIQVLARMTGKDSNLGIIDSALLLASRIPGDSARLDLTLSVFLGIGEGLESAGSSYGEILGLLSPASRDICNHLLDKAVASIAGNDPESIERAVRILSFGEFDRVRPPLAEVLKRSFPGRLQVSAIRSLARFGRGEVAAILLENWKGLAPSARSEALATLTRRKESIQSLLSAIESGALLPSDVDPTHRSRLLGHEDVEVFNRAKEILQAEEGVSRQEVIDRFKEALNLVGDASSGQAIHSRLCLVCHRIGDEGNDIGPNMALSERPPEELLVHILDPNREVAPAYVQYLVEDFEGNSYTGILKSETAHSVSLAREDTTQTIAREDIREIRSGGLSMMPEGLEQGMSLKDMADLLAFLASVQYDLGTPGDSFPEGHFSKHTNGEER